MANYGYRDGGLVVKKLTIADESGEPNAVVEYSILQASAVSTGAILTGYVLKGIGTADISAMTCSSFAKQPPYALNLVVCANGAETGRGDADHDPLTFKGYNAMGNHIQETLYVPSVSDATTSTRQAFAFISTISQRVGSASSSSDIGLSWGDIIGLPYPIATSDDIITFTQGTACGTTAIPVGSNGYNTIHPTLMEDAITLRIKYKTKYSIGGQNK